jgi:hypothetical protein
MDLVAEWKLHQEAGFPPSCLPISHEGAPLVRLDARAGALLTAALRRDGVPRPLPPVQVEELRDLTRSIGRALDALPLDAVGRAYFERLQRLARRLTE